MTDTYKIGRTKNNVDKRLKQLQTGCSSELFIVKTHQTEYAAEVEHFLHRKFLSKKQINEWFKLDASDISGFEDACLQMEDIMKCITTDEPVH